ncbi:MAG TPA: hypothetical protein PKC84_16700, partial [Paracoccaceae bacterium]|nr:hypothetical protein [Paracoccaceae bacterium]
RSRFLTGTMMLALFATGFPSVPTTVAKTVRPAPQQSFCRNADPLPRLEAEAQTRPQQTGRPAPRYRDSARDGAAPPPPATA